MTFLKDIQDKFKKTISNTLNRAFKKAEGKIRTRLREESLNIWKNTSTYRSLTTKGANRLSHQFGFPEGDAVLYVDGFLEVAAQSLDVKFKNFTGGADAFFNGGMQIFTLRQNLDNALESEFASFTTEKGFSIDWAEWLLVRGNEIIISDYIFRPGFVEYSRSGNGIMTKLKAGAFWRVPSTHSGIIGNNWLTRSLQESIKQIEKNYQVIIETEIGAVLE